jgi:DNA-binding Xre family transcriptional regulator
MEIVSRLSEVLLLDPIACASTRPARVLRDDLALRSEEIGPIGTGHFRVKTYIASTDMSDIGLQVGHRIRSMRLACGFTQETLALAAGMHPSYVGQIERGSKTIGLQNLARIAEALGCSPRDLLPSDTRWRRGGK